jgi:hypothetical protein
MTFAQPPERDELLGTFSGRVHPEMGVGKFQRKKNKNVDFLKC